MNKLITIFFSLFIFLTAGTSHIHAQQFEYEGTYLTTDGTQQIEGFHFDPINHRIIIIPIQYTSSFDFEKDGIKNHQRYQNILNYQKNYADTGSMTKEEITKFSEENEIDYAESLRNIADSEIIKENSSNSYLNLLLLVDTPGVHNLGIMPFIRLNISNPNNPGLVVITQPDIKFNQSLWEVSLFDIPTPILRFEAGTDTTTITDDFGITYEKQDTDYEFNW